MSLIKLIKALLSAFILALSVQCFSSDPEPADNTSSIGGTGSEVVGVVNYPDSSQGVKKRTSILVMQRPMSGARVFIHPRNFLPDINQVTDTPYGFTDSDGSFRIRNVVPGEHMVYIDNGSGMAVATIVSVPQKITTVECGYMTSAKTAQIQTQYQGSLPGDVLFYVAIRGTGLMTQCTQRNLAISLGNVPTGTNVSYTLTIRMFEPFRKSKDFSIPKLNPAEYFTLPFSDF